MQFALSSIELNLSRFFASTAPESWSWQDNVRVFGSVTKRDKEHPNDIDLLVQFQPERSLFDRIALMQKLGDLLGMPVDVVTEKGLHPTIRDEVIKSAQRL